MEKKQILQHVINKCDVEILNYKCDYVGVQFSKANGYYFLNEELHITYDGGSTGKSLKEIKLILRPLSDLTREIEVNGEKFVPLTELLKLSNFDVEKMNEREQLEFLDSFTNTLFMTFDDGQKLLEWHFDIHGLIKKDLAIDINNLNK